MYIIIIFLILAIMYYLNIEEPLKIINIKKINGNYEIHVISKCFYVYDSILENKIFFSD